MICRPLFLQWNKAFYFVMFCIVFYTITLGVASVQTCVIISLKEFGNKLEQYKNICIFCFLLWHVHALTNIRIGWNIDMYIHNEYCFPTHKSPCLNLLISYIFVKLVERSNDDSSVSHMLALSAGRRGVVNCFLLNYCTSHCPFESVLQAPHRADVVHQTRNSCA